MKKIHYKLWKEIEKNIKEFDFSNYVKTASTYENDEELIEYLKKYSQENVPISLDFWKQINIPDKCLVFRNSFYQQIDFIISIWRKLFLSLDNKTNEVLVISSYSSKSVILPVFYINLDKLGVEIILRYNLHDWKVSIKSKIKLDFETMGLFDENENYNSSYLEGFPKEMVFGSYNSSKYNFTIELDDDYTLYSFFVILINYLNKEQ